MSPEEIQGPLVVVVGSASAVQTPALPGVGVFHLWVSI